MSDDQTAENPAYNQLFADVSVILTDLMREAEEKGLNVAPYVERLTKLSFSNPMETRLNTPPEDGAPEAPGPVQSSRDVDQVHAE